MATPTKEGTVIQVPDGVLTDVHVMAREIIAQGETRRQFPNDDRPMFTVALTDAGLDLLLTTAVDGTPVYIGRLNAGDTPGASPTNG